MSTTAAVIVGVVAGVLTSGLLWAMGQFYRKVVRPWFEEVVYRGVQVGGVWEIQSRQSAQMAKLELRQHAHRLEGECTFMARESGVPITYEQMRSCTVFGTVQDRLVLLTFRHKESDRIGAGSLLLEIVRDGRVMTGIQTMYGVANGKIVSAEVVAGRPGVHEQQKQYDTFRELFAQSASNHDSDDDYDDDDDDEIARGQNPAEIPSEERQPQSEGAEGPDGGSEVPQGPTVWRRDAR